MAKQRDNQDARVWASSIGSDVIDIRDKRAPNAKHVHLKAALPLDALEALRDIGKKLESK